MRFKYLDLKLDKTIYLMLNCHMLHDDNMKFGPSCHHMSKFLVDDRQKN